MSVFVSRLGLGILTASLLSSASFAQAPLPSAEEMWRVIQEQARVIAEQGRQLEALKAAQGASTAAVSSVAAPPAAAPVQPVTQSASAPVATQPAVLQRNPNAPAAVTQV